MLNWNYIQKLWSEIVKDALAFTKHPENFTKIFFFILRYGRWFYDVFFNIVYVFVSLYFSVENLALNV